LLQSICRTNNPDSVYGLDHGSEQFPTVSEREGTSGMQKNAEGSWNQRPGDRKARKRSYPLNHTAQEFTGIPPQGTTGTKSNLFPL
jgi:hypothetical protein